MEKNKFDELFRQFGAAETDEEVSKRVNELINSDIEANITPDTLRQIYTCMDLTTLRSVDSAGSVRRFTEKVNMRTKGPNVAAICVYPVFAETVKRTLTAEGVKIAVTAGGFPSGQTFPEVKIAETALAVMAGADEIDAVINPGLFMDGDYEAFTDEIREIKESCRGAVLKVILETGALATAENIRRAAILALFSGADFLKTSTGKGYPGATPEAAYILCRVIGKYEALTGRKVGLKVSGGIRTAEDAVRYYMLTRELLGESGLNNQRFRIGASSLADDIESRLQKR